MFIATSLQVIRLAILANLLAPEAFGLMAIVMVVVGFAQIFSEMGLNEAIIQRPDPSREELSSLYWLNIAFGGLVFGIVWLITPWISGFLVAPELKGLLPVTAISFLILPWGMQFQALLQKNLRFKALATVEVISASANTLVAIFSACAGQGVWSLVWGQLAAAATRTVILCIDGLKMGYRPRLRVRPSEIKAYLS